MNKRRVVLILILVFIFSLLYFTSCKVEQGGNNDNIIDEDENIIRAYFDDTWENPQAIVNGHIYNMKNEGDFYSIEYNESFEHVYFTSNNKKTETFSIDHDSLCFVLGDVRFNNLYSGYFTDYKDVKNEVKKISLLTMNDLHGYIMQENSRGGISNTSYLINLIRDENDIDDVILGANGDMFQGTALSNLTEGRAVIDLMNAMDFDYMGIGNHEFDWGIDKIFALFDGNEENGEATFPLINSNIVNKKDNSLVLFDGYNIYDSVLINKCGVNVGIISCIGQVSSSIIYTHVKDYEFKEASDCAYTLAKKLRDDGADIVLVNIHGGSVDGVDEFYSNQTIATYTYNNKPLVDLVINGHTHTNQKGYIERDGADLPILQAGSYNYYLGEFELYFDTVTKTLTSSVMNSYQISSVGTNYDKDVEDIIDEYKEELKDQLEEVYCVSSEHISSRSSLYTWVSNVMTQAYDSDISICNNGGIRSTGDIDVGTRIGIEEVCMITPFDDEVFICYIKGKDIYKFLGNSSVFYDLKDGLSLSDLNNSNELYKVAVVDYVYYYNNFPKPDDFINSHITLKTLLIMDLRARSDFAPSKDSKAYIGKIFDEE